MEKFSGQGRGMSKASICTGSPGTWLTRESCMLLGVCCTSTFVPLSLDLSYRPSLLRFILEETATLGVMGKPVILCLACLLLERSSH